MGGRGWVVFYQTFLLDLTSKQFQNLGTVKNGSFCPLSFFLLGANKPLSAPPRGANKLMHLLSFVSSFSVLPSAEEGSGIEQ